MRAVHECECGLCQAGVEHPEQAWHGHINLLMSRLDEQQRRWYAAVEAHRIGHGGDRLVAQITGLDEKTIRRGREELEDGFGKRPADRIRVEGGGRPAVEKKARGLKRK